MGKAAGTDAHRDRILKVALALLTKGGRDAVTTRTVAEAAKVQAPVLYRIFGDKEGLLNAVTTYGFMAYLAKKQPPDALRDPVEVLRAGWDLHVGFGLANPELYLLMYANPRQGTESAAARQALAMLHEHMQDVAAVGRLRVTVKKACALYHAAAVGLVMSLLVQSREQRDLALSAVIRDHALAGITTEAPVGSTSRSPALANQLGALMQLESQESLFSVAERQLLSEWLLRIVDKSVRS